MQDSGTQTFVYPKTIGCAADLMFAVPCPITYLIDCLLLYNEVVIPADPMTMHGIYSRIEPGVLDPLFHSGRIKYCPAKSRPWTHYDSNKSYAEYIIDLPPFDSDDDRYSDIRWHIKEHLIDTDGSDYTQWKMTNEEALAAFNAASERKGYEWLYPEGRHGPDHFRRVGLETGIARINDLLVAGVSALDLDIELATYLEICFPVKKIDEIIENRNPARLTPPSLAENLHRIENLPPIGEMVRCGQLSPKEAISIINSEEASSLRDWLAKYVSPGVDVRDAYYNTLKDLPSKKAWTGWARFGVVSGISAAIASIVTFHPAVGIGIGLLVGGTDNKYGDKATERLFDDYHPREWMSYILQKGF